MIEPKKEYCLIVNRLSNSKRSLKTIKQNEQLIKERLGLFDLRVIEEKENITEVSRELANSYQTLIACGGDGTIQKVAAGIINSGTKLGIIPIGSGNDLVKTLNVGKSFEEHLEVINNGILNDIDVVQANSGIFVNTFGIGFDALSNYHTVQSKMFKGNLKYFFGALKAFLSFETWDVTIEINSTIQKYHTPMVILANGKWEGGNYLISPDSELDDGYFEVIIAQTKTSFELLKQFIRLSLGFQLSTKSVKRIKAQEIHFKTLNNVIGHADGEVIEPKSEFSFKLIPGCLKVYVAKV